MDKKLIDEIRNHIESTTMDAALHEWRELTREPNPIYNYRLDHVVEVVELSRYLAEQSDADIDVVTVAAWLHDVAKPGIGGIKKHADVSAEMAERFLNERELEGTFIERVCDVIRKHAGLSLDEPLEPIEAQVVWEADKLTKIGAIGFVHFLLNTVRMKPDQLLTDMYKELVSFRSLWTGIAKSMYTPAAKKLARERLENLESIADMMERELRSSKSKR